MSKKRTNSRVNSKKTAVEMIQEVGYQNLSIEVAESGGGVSVEMF